MARVWSARRPRWHVYPLLATLQELKRRRHELSVRTLTSEVDVLVGLGFEANRLTGAGGGEGDG